MQIWSNNPQICGETPELHRARVPCGSLNSRLESNDEEEGTVRQSRGRRVSIDHPFIKSQSASRNQRKGSMWCKSGHVTPRFTGNPSNSTHERGPLSYERGPLSYERVPLSNERAPLSYERGPLSYERGPLSDERKEQLLADI